MDFHHVSVLLSETLDGLAIKPDGTYVDCTLGGGGHSHAIGERLSSKGMIVGLDQDVAALEAASQRLSDLSCQVKVIQTNFSNLKEALQDAGIYEVDGFVFDLGVSSHQLDTADRGFSYMQDGPLDMRMNQSGSLTAERIVNTYSSEALYQIIWDYGEERWAKRIVQFIVEAREESPIVTTFQLVDIIKRAIPAKARQDGPHPAKRTFQALRIEVNQELQILHDAFVDATSMLKSNGRIAVITFHSLEDRITKQTFKELDDICKPEAIFATNTSSLSITEIGAGLKRPMIGMHFFNPAPVMKLVEIIAGLNIPTEVVDKIKKISEDIGKVPVQVQEAPGFVVNRILIPMINEAVGIYAEGIASVEGIDSAMKLGANHPIGPLALGDLIGLDVCLAIMDVLYHETGDSKYRAHTLLRKMVRGKQLGQKTGKGFYDYTK